MISRGLLVVFAILSFAALCNTTTIGSFLADASQEEAVSTEFTPETVLAELQSELAQEDEEEEEEEVDEDEAEEEEEEEEEEADEEEEAAEDDEEADEDEADEEESDSTDSVRFAEAGAEAGAESKRWHTHWRPWRGPVSRPAPPRRWSPPRANIGGAQPQRRSRGNGGNRGSRKSFPKLPATLAKRYAKLEPAFERAPKAKPGVGGKGTRRLALPRSKGCFITTASCAKDPSIKGVFADGYFHNQMKQGWFGGKEQERKCLQRAEAFWSYCGADKTVTVSARWRPTGARAYAPAGGCWIRQSACKKYPQYKGFFRDTFDNARSGQNQARCFARAREFHKWCNNDNTVTTTAEYRPSGRVKDYPENKGCFIYGDVCPKGKTVGYFRDRYGEANGNTGIDEEACLRRAADYHKACGAPLDEFFIAEYKPSGRTRVFPADLQRPISFVGVKPFGNVKCKLLNAHTLELRSQGNEGACQIPFANLGLPAKKSLSDRVISFDVEYTRNPQNGVGRHGGIYMGAKASGRHNENVMTDWIDRASDRGYRIYGKLKNGRWNDLAGSTRQPFERWTITIRSDGTYILRAGDVTWTAKSKLHKRDKPYLGFWVYNSVNMKITNFSIRKYTATTKYVDFKKVQTKGSASCTVLNNNGVFVRSAGGEGSCVLKLSEIGFPKKRSLANKLISFDVEFLRGGPSVGRHGGIFLGPNSEGRTGNAVVDWIEAGSNRGFRQYWQMDNEKWDYWAPNGQIPQHWTIAIDANLRMQLTAGNTVWNSKLRNAWNDGFLGFWVYNGVFMRISNVLVTDLNSDVCSSRPCANGGACTVQGSSFSCDCPAGFKGADCSINIDDCTPEAIASCNGGKCIDGANTFTCNCAGTGRFGKQCNGFELTGWVRADDAVTVSVDGQGDVLRINGWTNLKYLKTAAVPGSFVTFKVSNYGWKGMLIASLAYRGQSILTSENWQCSTNKGASWSPAHVIGRNRDRLPFWQSTTNIPGQAAYIFDKNEFAKDVWCRYRLPAKSFKTGDRVMLELKNSETALCSKPSGSITYIFGTICRNGGIKWKSAYTPYKEMIPQFRQNPESCAWSRGVSKSWDADYFGDCKTVPKRLAHLLPSAQYSAYPNLRAETDPCKDSTANPCAKPAKCSWNLKGPVPFKCSCPPGYTGKGTVVSPCEEEDQCKSENPCHPNAKCKKTGPGQFTCRCRAGFYGNGKQCKEIDPCLASPSPCDVHAICKKTGPGMHMCTCRTGYKGTGKKCTEINSCKPNPCDKNAVCKSTGPGTHSCKCKSGFAGDGVRCKAVDACNPSPCSPFAECAVEGKKAKCTCKKGYRGDGKLCVEIDPCADKKDLCGANAFCTKTGPGAYKCKCNRGFEGDGKKCTEINGCKSNPCHKDASCTKTGPGTYKCACKDGFAGNGKTCRSASSCADKPCDAHADCTTLAPTKYKCTCKAGFKGDGKTCEAIDACASAPCDVNAVCKSTGPNTHTCTCKDGYRGTGLKCTEKDPCEGKPCGSGGVCTKTGFGKYKCTCTKGYTAGKLGDKDTCIEVDNCKVPTSCGPNALCTKTGPGTHTCQCKRGYKGDAYKGCDEIDNCLSNPCNANAVCIKTGPGTHKCECNKGYQGDGVTTCNEVDNCLVLNNACDINALCTKTGPGTHKCECKEGYDGNGLKCTPHDNCISSPCGDLQTCVSTGPAKHTCRCIDGYQYNAESVCVPINPCSAKVSPCDKNAECTFVAPGKHTCTCRSGYSGDGKTCEAIDACKAGPCHKFAECTVLGPNKYRCECRVGYEGDGKFCEEINMCVHKNPCDPNANCIKTGPGTAACECSEGYHGDGQTCKEINRCASDSPMPFPCSAHADCTHLGLGKFRCECKPGYLGDGYNCKFDSGEMARNEKTHAKQEEIVTGKVDGLHKIIMSNTDTVQNRATTAVDDTLDKLKKKAESVLDKSTKTNKNLDQINKYTQNIESKTQPLAPKPAPPPSAKFVPVPLPPDHPEHTQKK